MTAAPDPPASSDAYIRIRNDGPRRVFVYDWCRMDVDQGRTVGPALRTRWRGAMAPIDESEPFDAGEESWRTLTFEYPIASPPPHFLTCGPVRFEVPPPPPK